MSNNVKTYWSSCLYFTKINDYIIIKNVSFLNLDEWGFKGCVISFVFPLKFHSNCHQFIILLIRTIKNIILNFYNNDILLSLLHVDKLWIQLFQRNCHHTTLRSGSQILLKKYMRQRLIKFMILLDRWFTKYKAIFNLYSLVLKLSLDHVFCERGWKS